MLEFERCVDTISAMARQRLGHPMYHPGVAFGFSGIVSVLRPTVKMLVSNLFDIPCDIIQVRQKASRTLNQLGLVISRHLVP